MATQRRGIALVTTFLVFAFSAWARTQQRGPSTPEERARAVQVAQKLQTDPLAADVLADREWLVKWLIEVPDMTVSLCSEFLGDMGDSKTGYPGAIIATMMASQAAFLIEHPDQSKDRNAQYLSGVEGALKAYEAIHAKDPNYKPAHLGELIEVRDKGKLADYVRETAKKKCEPGR